MLYYIGVEFKLQKCCGLICEKFWAEVLKSHVGDSDVADLKLATIFDDDRSLILVTSFECWCSMLGDKIDQNRHEHP